ncbi:MAG: RNA polymerase sigma factor for flagellar operon FliA [Kiritimatiellia bacterium]|jgi:RNA polymerase sigma factor for flagellar operon FliA
MSAAAIQLTEERREQVLQHYSMVRAIACRIYQRLPKAVELDDLISAGVTGLIEAIDRYDPSRKVPFETFAKHRVHGAIVDALRAADWVPRSVRRKADLIRNSRLRLEASLGREPSREEMAENVDVTVKKYDALVRDSQIRSLLSLDAPMGDGNPTPLVEQVSSEFEDPTLAWQDAELKVAMHQALDRLPAREKSALALYYLHELSLKEVGGVLGVTESRACQLCGQGIKRLKRRLSRYAA